MSAILLALALVTMTPPAGDDSPEMKQSTMCFMAGHLGFDAMPKGPAHELARRPWLRLAIEASRRTLAQLRAEGQTEPRAGLMEDAAAAIDRVGGRDVVARACWKAYGIEAPR